MTTINAPMTIIDAIKTRRSVRSFGPQRLDRTVINELLAAAVRAPTARHEEPWAFAIIQDKLLLRHVSDRAKKMIAEDAYLRHDRGGHDHSTFAQPEFNIFYNAGTLIAICGRAQDEFVVADCWLAAENLMLAACAVGVGTCVIGSAVPALNDHKTKDELGIPAEISVVAPIIVGVPDGTGRPTPRKDPKVLTWK